ncbi:hypothetical protein BJ546DRAFT_98037 [Cryomyces antarcticus]
MLEVRTPLTSCKPWNTTQPKSTDDDDADEQLITRSVLVHARNTMFFRSLDTSYASASSEWHTARWDWSLVRAMLCGSTQTRHCRTGTNTSPSKADFLLVLSDTAYHRLVKRCASWTVDLYDCAIFPKRHEKKEPVRGKVLRSRRRARAKSTESGVWRYTWFQRPPPHPDRDLATCGYAHRRLQGPAEDLPPKTKPGSMIRSSCLTSHH